MSNAPVRSRRGFTLIELLVVISIIALLISILLPALGRARSAAKQLACLSTIRQLGIAAVQYGDDYRDFALPVSITDPQAPSGWNTTVSWWGNRGYFPKLNLRATHGQSIEDGGWGDWHLLCPDARYAAERTPNPTGRKGFIANSYGMNSVGLNAAGISRIYNFNMQESGLFFKRQMLQQPGKKLLLADSMTSKVIYFYANPDSGIGYYPNNPEVPSDGNIALRHSNGASVFFHDGHAAYVKGIGNGAGVALWQTGPSAWDTNGNQVLLWWQKLSGQ